MALDKKSLAMLLNNPGKFDPRTAGMDEESGEVLAPDESSDGAMKIPAIDPESDLTEQEPDIADPDEVDQSIDLDKDQLASNQPKHEVDSDIMTKLRKLKAGESIDESDESQVQDAAADMKAPMEMRKKALQQIKQKYLGQ